MITKEDIIRVLKPFSKDLRRVNRIKNAMFCVSFKPSVDDVEVKRVLEEELKPEYVSIDRREVEVLITIVDWD